MPNAVYISIPVPWSNQPATITLSRFVASIIVIAGSIIAFAIYALH